MEGWSPQAFPLPVSLQAIDLLFRVIPPVVPNYIPIDATSFLIGLAVMVGLKHPLRRRIYDHLCRLPGDHFRSVARSLDIPIGTTRYHLDALVREGLVSKHDTNGRARYYVTGGEADVNRLYARHWEYREVRLRILEALRRMQRAQPATIAKSLRISRQLASYHLAVLAKAGLVRRQGAHYRLVGGRVDV